MQYLSETQTHLTTPHSTMNKAAGIWRGRGVWTVNCCALYYVFTGMAGAEERWCYWQSSNGGQLC